jgi:hypothetical protein
VRYSDVHLPLITLRKFRPRGRTPVPGFGIALPSDRQSAIVKERSLGSRAYGPFC